MGIPSPCPQPRACPKDEADNSEAAPAPQSRSKCSGQAEPGQSSDGRPISREAGIHPRPKRVGGAVSPALAAEGPDDGREPGAAPCGAPGVAGLELSDMVHPLELEHQDRREWPAPG